MVSTNTSTCSLNTEDADFAENSIDGVDPKLFIFEIFISLFERCNMFTSDQVTNAKKVLRFGRGMLTKALLDEEVIEQHGEEIMQGAKEEVERIDALSSVIGVVDLNVEQLATLFKHIDIIHSFLNQIDTIKALGMPLPDHIENNAFIKFSQEEVSLPDLMDLGNRVIELGRPLEEAANAELADSEGNPVSIYSTVKH